MDPVGIALIALVPHLAKGFIAGLALAALVKYLRS